jgi:dTDP-glucose pyrophosphorylase
VSAITKAVLLAAGRGSRLGTLTERFPKPLLEVGGEPILFRILRGLAAAGVTEVAIVTGHAADLLERETGRGERRGLALTYFRQRSIDGTARAVALARAWLSGQPFFVGWGDIVVEEASYAPILEAGGRHGAALAVNHVQDPAAGAAVYVDGRGFVERLVEKPAPGTSRTNWNNAGLSVLPPAIWPYIDALEPSPRGEYELPEAIAAFAAEHRVKAVPISGPWFDIGTPENLAAARAHFGS